MIVCHSAAPASSPLPRLRARSMLSCGTEFLRAFCMASYSVGLASGSPPPVRAATSTFLINLANSLPRLASTAAFLCLVVAHLEWPLISPPSTRKPAPEPAPRKWASRSGRANRLHEKAVHPPVTGQLRMERGGEHRSLPNCDDPTDGRPGRWRVGDPGEYLDVVRGGFHPRGADEHGVHRPAVQVREVEVG